MKAIEIFERAKNGEYERILRLLKKVEDRLITPQEAVEILEDETGVVVLETFPNR
ncbi:MAG: hypothetical protein WC587_02935 [Candidatus Paceibacterota bacterium]